MSKDNLKEALAQLSLLKAHQYSTLGQFLQQLQQAEVNTLLLQALEEGRPEVAHMLVAAGADVNHTDLISNCPLHLAARTDQPDIVTALLHAGADIDACNDSFETPLFWACQRGNVRVALTLLTNGASLNIANVKGYTPLTLAAQYGHRRLVELLVLYGADVEAQNVHGETALMKACQNNKPETARLLLHFGADVGHVSQDGNTSLHHAVRSNARPELCRDLVALGADLNAVNEEEMTPLIIAAKYERSEILNFLIASGADLTRKNKHCRSALWYSVCHSLTACSPCLLALLQAGVHIDHELHCAVGVGLLEVVKTMLRFGATPVAIPTSKLNIRPAPPLETVSPLCMALLAQNTDVARYLLKVGCLTAHDLHSLTGNRVLRQYLEETAKRESLIFLDTELERPFSLATLCLTTVSQVLGYNPQVRWLGVKATGLPPMFQRRLMFQ